MADEHDGLRSSRDAVAVMQPYFYPYAGYFRLLAAAEIFVIFDDVQFPRRGRVHRCEVPRPVGGSNSALEWLTLPLARQPRDTLIKDLASQPTRAVFSTGALSGTPGSQAHVDTGPIACARICTGRWASRWLS